MPSDDARLRIIDEILMPAEMDAGIRRLLCICFPHDAGVFSTTRAWHGSGPAFTAVAGAEGDPIAHVGVIDRTVTVDARPLRIAGVQNVAVSPQFRGRGWSGRALALAMEEALRRDFDAGLLFCGRRRVPLYERSGWRRLDQRLIVRVVAGRELTPAPLPAENALMFCPLRLDEFPEGLIHLRGDDW